MRMTFVWVWCTLAVAAQADMIVFDYVSAEHERFHGAGETFIGDPYDWSGVGRSSGGTWATMISPTHFLSAAHYHPGVSSSVTFFHTNTSGGASESYSVASGGTIAGTDLWLGTLSGTPSASVARYGLLSLPSASDYLGLTLYNFGDSATAPPEAMRLGRNIVEGISSVTVSSVTATAILFDYDDTADGPSTAADPYGTVGDDETSLVGGDSGGPSFILTSSGPALVGIHWFAYTGGTGEDTGSGDSYVPGSIPAITTAMTGGEAPTLITAVPEPHALALLLLAWAARRKRAA